MENPNSSSLQDLELKLLDRGEKFSQKQEVLEVVQAIYDRSKIVDNFLYELKSEGYEPYFRGGYLKMTQSAIIALQPSGLTSVSWRKRTSKLKSKPNNSKSLQASGNPKVRIESNMLKLKGRFWMIAMIRIQIQKQRKMKKIRMIYKMIIQNWKTLMMTSSGC